MSWENLQNPFPKLVMVKGSVESNRKTIADRHVTYVQARFTQPVKDVNVFYGGVGTLGLNYLVVNCLSIDKGYCEAVGCELDGEMDGWDYMTLERVCK